MRNARTMDVAAVPTTSPSPQRIRWGAVFAGVVFGLALLALLTTLWLALAFNSGVDEIRTDIEWYIGGSAALCLFLGAVLAGWLSGVRGAGSGFFNGITMWGLILIVALVVGIPSTFNVFNLGRVSSLAEGATLIDSRVDTALWASFWTLLGSFVAAGVGGMIGGAITGPSNASIHEPGVIERDRDARDTTLVVDDGHEHDHVAEGSEVRTVRVS